MKGAGQRKSRGRQNSQAPLHTPSSLLPLTVSKLLDLWVYHLRSLSYISGRCVFSVAKYDVIGLEV